MDSRANPMAHLAQMKQELALLDQWNATYRPLPPKGLAELFEQQVHDRPGELAVIDGPTGLTYGELNCQANRLAHHLRELGVGPNALVGISLQRSWQMIVSLLAIVKAGGAYVPLDPEYPPEPLGFIPEDTNRKRGLTPTRPTLAQ